MHDLFDAEYDAAGRLLKLRLTGIWNEAAVDRLRDQMTQLQAGVAATNAPAGRGRILIDLRDFPVQPQSVAERLGRLIPDLAVLAGRIAIIGSASALQRLQARRLIDDGRAAFVDDEPAAMAWLAAAA